MSGSEIVSRALAEGFVRAVIRETGATDFYRAGEPIQREGGLIEFPLAGPDAAEMIEIAQRTALKGLQ